MSPGTIAMSQEVLEQRPQLVRVLSPARLDYSPYQASPAGAAVFPPLQTHTLTSLTTASKASMDESMKELSASNQPNAARINSDRQGFQSGTDSEDASRGTSRGERNSSPSHRQSKYNNTRLVKIDPRAFVS